MSKMILAAVGVLFGVNTAMCAVDWSTVTGEYEIPEGASEVVTDADVPYVNALTKLTVNGAVRFDTATPPTMPLEGTGVCSKTNDDDWTMETAWKNWKGKWIFDGGKIIAGASQCFGNYNKDVDGKPYSEVHFRTNATLHLAVQPTTYWLLYQGVHVSGNGKDGVGAILFGYPSSRNGAIGEVTLDDDASFGMPNTAVAQLHYGTLNLNGHVLTLVDSTQADKITALTLGDGERVAGPGEIVVPPGMQVNVSGTDNFQFLDASPRTKLTLQGDNTLYFERGKDQPSCAYPDQYVDIDAHGTCTIWHTHQNAAGYPTAPSDDCGVVLVGDISIPEASDSLQVCSWLSNGGKLPVKCPIEIRGNITGLGSVSLPTSPQGLRYTLSGTNSTYSGATTLRLDYGGTLELAHPGSIGADSQLTSYGGYFSLPVGVEDGWTTNDITALARRTAPSGDVVLAMDASAADGGAVTVDASFWKDCWKSGLVLGACGGTVSVMGPLDGEAACLAAVGGTLRITGTEPIVLKSAWSKTRTYSSEPGTLLFDGATDVTLPNGATILIPRVDINESEWASQARSGRMVVSNATFKTQLPTYESLVGNNDVWYSAVDRAVQVGVTAGSAGKNMFHPGVVEFRHGADFTGKLLVGNLENDVGAVFQSGGTVRNIG